MKGRKPKPTALRLIEGNREHRTIHAELEPRPDKTAPPCPRELKGNARKAWKYLVRELGKMGCLASSDRGQMTAYSRAWGVWCKAEMILAKSSGVQPETVINRAGNEVESPWFRMANRAIADVVKYGAELGLNPVQRTRVKLEQQPSADRQERLMS